MTEYETSASMGEEKKEASTYEMEEESVPSFTAKGSPRLVIRQMVRDVLHAHRVHHQSEAFHILISIFSCLVLNKYERCWKTSSRMEVNE